MELDKIIRELYSQKEKLNRVIADLEELLASGFVPQAPERRGRKAMGPTERLEVSERMKDYWSRRSRNSVKRRGAPAGSPDK